MIKTVFTLPSIKREAETLLYFCSSSNSTWDWSGIVYKNHPQLEIVLKGAKKKDRYPIVYAYTKTFINNPTQRLRLHRLVDEYQRTWDLVNDDFIKVLSRHFETKIPTQRKRMTGYISIVPIFPRDIDTWSFNVSSRNTSLLVPVTMHEILHFFYFKKWMEVFPKTKRKELDSPHLVWMLSEILDPIILNHQPEIQALHPHIHGHYSEFQELKINNVSVTKHFEKLYKKHLKGGDSFESFLRTCWDEMVLHKEVFKGNQ